ncbi:DUF305 domain-containing protein [Hoyosella sp. G463]|uniref:DUF305 domain-containing protein n=1 Tax=Lolliginicoccus lacisalsi TaxID=2742202 RepID=A0A927JEU5_9ACTN|nr:DUF305 domain-containing protein [Lolliginicoccus lacisalsi]MBD8507853.1 DUF305 domain-containing protein [Lolliginicoccus lacisalsi]
MSPTGRRLVPLLVITTALGMAIGFLLGATIGGDDAALPANADPNASDIGFSQDMSAHHLQAVSMSAAVLTTTSDPSIRTLSFDILTAQENQIGQMQGWLQAWGEPRFAPGDPMTWMPSSEHDGHDMSDMAMSEGARMPGMATSQEMARLRGLEGSEQDVYFLQLMLRHHQGGLPMAEAAIEQASTPLVTGIAQRMLDGQKKEIDLMTELLAERGAEPIPFN